MIRRTRSTVSGRLSIGAMLGRFSIGALLVGLVGLAGCAGEQMDAESDAEGAQPDIEAVNARFETYVMAQQWDSLIALYTEDAIFMPQGAPMAEGAAIRDGFVQMGEAGITGIDLETVDFEIAGNSAYEVGTYSLQGPHGMRVDEGKYLVVWKNVDGQWKIHRDMINSDQPFAPAIDSMPTDTTLTDTTTSDPSSSGTRSADTPPADTSAAR